MNFEKIDEDIYEGRKTRLQKADALRYVFHLIEQYAKEAQTEDASDSFYVSVITELKDYVEVIETCGWDNVSFEQNPMAASEIVISKGSELWMSD